MNELAIVDLEAHLSPEYSAATIASIEAMTGQKSTTFGIHDALDGLREAQRIFVTGSADMIAEVAWATDVARAIEDAASAGVPVLAVCFGHQMMAKHFGGRITRFPKVRKGLHNIRFAATGPFGGDHNLIHTHRDYVIEPGQMMPAGGGGFGGIAALRHPSLPIWTCQGHPEWNQAICAVDGAAEWNAFDAATLNASGATIMQAFAKLAPS
jgi:GMP synthase-like glutamine amidotransferase